MLQGVLGKKLLFLVHIPMFYNVEKTQQVMHHSLTENQN